MDTGDMYYKATLGYQKKTETTMRRFENHLGNHNKFWEIDTPVQVGSAFIVTTRWGRIGTYGDSKPQTFYSRGQAESFVQKKIIEKIGRGYTEIGSKAETPPPLYAYTPKKAEPIVPEQRKKRHIDLS